MLRRHRIAESLGIRLPAAAAADARPWHAVVMSRLGRSPLARRVELATLYRWTEQAVARGEVPICVAGTAAYPWVCRACELLGSAPCELDLWTEPDSADQGERRIDSGEVSSIAAARVTLEHRPDSALAPSRDELAVMLADHVDVPWVRPGGTIFRLLQARLSEDPTASVRVLIPVPGSKCMAGGASKRTAQQLIARGAIGFCWRWDECDERSDRSAAMAGERPVGGIEALPRCGHPGEVKACAEATAALLDRPDRWLIHCTRARGGAWPGQSLQQFRDWLLLSAPQRDDLSPMATLKRIIIQRQLIGTARTLKGSQPVVCFSAEPLLDVVGRRSFRSHLGRWDAEPYGIAIDLDAAKQLGAQPVIYSRPGEAFEVPEQQVWRRQAAGRTFDWTAEREWRIRSAVDLRGLPPHQVIVFVDRDEQLADLPQMPWSAVSIESLQHAHRSRCGTPVG